MLTNILNRIFLDLWRCLHIFVTIKRTEWWQRRGKWFITRNKLCISVCHGFFLRLIEKDSEGGILVRCYEITTSIFHTRQYIVHFDVINTVLSRIFISLRKKIIRKYLPGCFNLTLIILLTSYNNDAMVKLTRRG